MRHGNVGNGAPDPVGLVIDPEDPNGDSGTSRRASPFGITAQAVDAAVQRHKHAVHIHHTDSTDITVANGISAQGFLIRVFSRLFHGGGNPNMVTVAAIHIQDLDEDGVINFSIDSTETVRLDAPYADFSTAYTVEGSANSVKIKELTLKQMQLQNNVNALIQSMQARQIGADVFEDSLAALMKNYKDEVKINYIS